METKRKIFKPRNIFLLTATLVLLIVTLAGMISIGKNYTVWDFQKSNPETDKPVVTESRTNIVKIEDTSIKKVNGYYSIAIRIQSVNAGETTITIKNNDSDTPIKYHFYVLPSGIIFEGNNFFNSNSNCYTILLPSVYIFILIMTIFLVMKYREKRKKGEFSYSLVAIGGVILYFAGNILTFLILYLNVLLESLPLDGTKLNIFMFMNVPAILNLLAQSGTIFAFISCPLLLLFALAVSISNISLVRHEGFRPLNLLGIISGIAFVSGLLVILFMATRDFQGSEQQYKLFSTINIALSFTFCYVECMLLSTINCSFMATRYKLSHNQDYIIILGCAIRKDGTPTPLLKSRIDRAVDFEREQFEKTGRHAFFVPSGGQGPDEVVSEAECMKNYLIEQGIARDRIIPEDKSVNTFQNMKFSKAKIEEHAGNLKNVNIAFSTTNYHVFRGYILSKKVGMKAKGLSAKTKLYFYPNAFVREFIGLLYEEKLRHALFIVSIIVLFIIFMLFGT